MVEAEHLVEEAAVHGAEEWGQSQVRQCRPGRVLQGLGACLDTHEVQGLGPLLQEPAQAHIPVDMQKIEARAGLDAEQQVQNGAAQGRFAGLVGTDDEVKVPLGMGQGDGAVGELAVANQVESGDAHRSLSRPWPGAPAGPAPPPAPGPPGRRRGWPETRAGPGRSSGGARFTSWRRSSARDASSTGSRGASARSASRSPMASERARRARVGGRLGLDAHLLDPEPLDAHRRRLTDDLFAQMPLSSEEFPVGGGLAGEAHPHRQVQAAGVGIHEPLKGPPDQPHHLVQGRSRTGIHLDQLPAQHVHQQALDPQDAGLVGADQHRAMGARLADVAPLQVAGEDHPGVRLEQGITVHMAQGPVVVALGRQLRQGAWCIVAHDRHLPSSAVCRTPMLSQPGTGGG